MARFRWYQIFQIVVLAFTTVLLLSKSYELLNSIFSIFYESRLAVISVVIGVFSILHGGYMVIMSFAAREGWNVREFKDSLGIVACGGILLSPAFNNLFVVPGLAWVGTIRDDAISYLAYGLFPIIIVYLIDIFRDQTD